MLMIRSNEGPRSLARSFPVMNGPFEEPGGWRRGQLRSPGWGECTGPSAFSDTWTHAIGGSDKRTERRVPEGRPCSEYHRRRSWVGPSAVTICAEARDVRHSMDAPQQLRSARDESCWPPSFSPKTRYYGGAGSSSRVDCSDCDARTFCFRFLSEDDPYKGRGVLYGARNGNEYGCSRWEPSRECSCCRCFYHFEGDRLKKEAVAPLKQTKNARLAPRYQIEHRYPRG